MSSRRLSVLLGFTARDTFRLVATARSVQDAVKEKIRPVASKAP